MACKYHVVTYATHNKGMLAGLVNNKFAVPVSVLGWGSKWHGYTDKIKGVLNFCKKVPATDIVIFIDGFDTIMHQHPDIAVSRFLRFDTPHLVVASVEGTSKWVPETVYRRMFGPNFSRCKINSGMYMGYAGRLQDFLERVLHQSTTDDQRAFNACCRLVSRDINSTIFLNVVRLMRKCPTVDKNEKAVFVSFPASGGCVSVYERCSYFVQYTMHRLPGWFSLVEWCAILFVIYVCIACVIVRLRSRNTGIHR